MARAATVLLAAALVLLASASPAHSLGSFRATQASLRLAKGRGILQADDSDSSSSSDGTSSSTTVIDPAAGLGENPSPDTALSVCIEAVCGGSEFCDCEQKVNSIDRDCRERCDTDDACFQECFNGAVWSLFAATSGMGDPGPVSPPTKEECEKRCKSPASDGPTPLERPPEPERHLLLWEEQTFDECVASCMEEDDDMMTITGGGGAWEEPSEGDVTKWCGEICGATPSVPVTVGDPTTSDGASATPEPATPTTPEPATRHLLQQDEDLLAAGHAACMNECKDVSASGGDIWYWGRARGFEFPDDGPWEDWDSQREEFELECRAECGVATPVLTPVAEPNPVTEPAVDPVVGDPNTDPTDGSGAGDPAVDPVPPARRLLQAPTREDCERRCEVATPDAATALEGKPPERHLLLWEEQTFDECVASCMEEDDGWMTITGGNPSNEDVNTATCVKDCVKRREDEWVHDHDHDFSGGGGGHDGPLVPLIEIGCDTVCHLMAGEHEECFEGCSDAAHAVVGAANDIFDADGNLVLPSDADVAVRCGDMCQKKQDDITTTGNGGFDKAGCEATCVEYATQLLTLAEPLLGGGGYKPPTSIDDPGMDDVATRCMETCGPDNALTADGSHMYDECMDACISEHADGLAPEHPADEGNDGTDYDHEVTGEGGEAQKQMSGQRAQDLCGERCARGFLARPETSTGETAEPYSNIAQCIAGCADEVAAGRAVIDVRLIEGNVTIEAFPSTFAADDTQRAAFRGAIAAMASDAEFPVTSEAVHIASVRFAEPVATRHRRRALLQADDATVIIVYTIHLPDSVPEGRADAIRESASNKDHMTAGIASAFPGSTVSKAVASATLLVSEQDPEEDELPPPPTTYDDGDDSSDDSSDGMGTTKVVAIVASTVGFGLGASVTVAIYMYCRRHGRCRPRHGGGGGGAPATGLPVVAPGKGADMPPAHGTPLPPPSPTKAGKEGGEAPPLPYYPVTYKGPVAESYAGSAGAASAAHFLGAAPGAAVVEAAGGDDEIGPDAADRDMLRGSGASPSSPAAAGEVEVVVVAPKAPTQAWI